MRHSLHLLLHVHADEQNAPTGISFIARISPRPLSRPARGELLAERRRDNNGRRFWPGFSISYRARFIVNAGPAPRQASLISLTMTLSAQRRHIARFVAHIRLLHRHRIKARSISPMPLDFHGRFPSLLLSHFGSPASAPPGAGSGEMPKDASAEFDYASRAELSYHRSYRASELHGAHAI